ncbi:MAG: DNA-binding transcriptional regulator [Pseudomonadota bacterium]
MRLAVDSKVNSVRALSRGLSVLAAVSDGKGAKPAEIAAQVGIPRPTVYRLLETLEELGYVSRSASDNRFRVTLKTRAIAQGYDAETQIGEVAGPILARLGSEIVWPIDLSTYEDGWMVIRETTHARSPMSIDRNMIGFQLPVLLTASGRAFLAFSPPSVRDACLDLLRARDDALDRPFLDPLYLDRILKTCRAKDYGMRLGESFIPKTSSFAVPVMEGGLVTACITVIWITSALSVSRAEQELLPSLRLAAAEIAEQLEVGHA